MFSVIENSLNLDTVNLDALYLVKLIFGEYLCYFDSNCIAVLLQLQLYLDVNRVLVCERGNSFHTEGYEALSSKFRKCIGVRFKELCLSKTDHVNAKVGY